MTVTINSCEEKERAKSDCSVIYLLLKRGGRLARTTLMLSWITVGNRYNRFWPWFIREKQSLSVKTKISLSSI